MAMPPLYARWTASLLNAEVPVESLSTCSDCAMCRKPDGAVPTSAYVFDETIKCCVYMPVLRNFAVGGILTDPDPDGIASVRERLADPSCTTPTGINRPATYDLVYRNTVNVIGRARTLRCPHFIEDGGRCGIWQHRDALCTTWFCKHEKGAAGARFWRALQSWLEAVEIALARWCALELGIAPQAIVAADGVDSPPEGPAVDGRADPADAAFWGPWLNDKEGFYKRCAALVERLTLDEVRAIAGIEAKVREMAALAAFTSLSRPTPAHLTTGSFNVMGTRRDGGVRAVTYSSLDALDIPSQLIAVLPLFDGRPTEAVLKQLDEQYKIQIDPAYITMLADWGVLVEALTG